MLQKSFLFLTPLLLTGCMMAPAPQEPRWTDEALVSQPPQEAPVYVRSVMLSSGDRTELSAEEADVVAAGRDVLDQGNGLRAPAPDSERYAAEQRERAQPPQ